MGVEIDVRDHGGTLVLEHDPFKSGEPLTQYLESYRQSCLVVNIKSSGIEENVVAELRKFGITDYFFLDSALSIAVRMRDQKLNFAGRISEYESIESLRLSSDLFSWIWVDCFTKFSLTAEQFEELKTSNKKICITGPDLLGRPEDIDVVRRKLDELEIIPDAICTKITNVWKWRV